MAGRRTSLASLAGQKVDAVPGQSDPLLLTLPLAKLVPTRFNPRRNFGTEDDLKAFGLILKRRQLQPAVVVSRAAYLKLWPEEESAVGTAQYVIANGERRYRGSLAADLTTLNVVHNEDVAKSRADFLDAVLSENNDREDLDPIERALGIETMVAELGGADQVAQHYGKTKGWVSQQRKLLKLIPELQSLVSTREMPVRVARDIASLPPDEQASAWAEESLRRQEPKAPRTRTQPAVPPQDSEPARPPAGPEPVYRGKPAEDPAPPPERDQPTPASPTPRALPEPRTSLQPEPPQPSTDDADKPTAPEGRTSTAPVSPEPEAPLLPTRDWRELLNLIVAELSEADRHHLTGELLRLKIKEKPSGAEFR